MAGGGTQQSLRKALGAIKDSTRVGLAKVNSDYKELDVAIVKATNHVERPAKEKYMQNIFAAVSAARPRADVAYCIHALARRLAKTHNWAVALKTLIVIHRALREVDATFREELVKYGRRNPMLNLAHFKDDSSPHAWDYSAWIRQYALFLEERLECFYVLKYDVEADYPLPAPLHLQLLHSSNLHLVVGPLLVAAHAQEIHVTPHVDHNIQMTLKKSHPGTHQCASYMCLDGRTKDLATVELLEQLSALQLLLFRLIACEPLGAAVYNNVVQVALSIVAGESVKIYNAICDGTINMIDKFFEMRRDDAVKALEIYRKAGKQAKQLSSFYELCKSLGLGRGERFPKIKQPPESFLNAMEEYVLNAPLALVRKDQDTKNKIAPPKAVLALEYKKVAEVEEAPKASPPLPEPVKVEAPTVETADLLGLGDPSPVASDLDEKNSMALAIVPVSIPSTAAASGSPDLANGTTGWELALVTAPSSNESTMNIPKLGGGLDKLTLDSLYDEALRQDALRQANQNASYNQWNTAPFTHMTQIANDPFRASNAFSASHNVQMAAMVYQQQAFMFQQQMMVAQQLPQQSINPFGNPYAVGTQQYGPGMHPHIRAYNPYAGYT